MAEKKQRVLVVTHPNGAQHIANVSLKKTLEFQNSKKPEHMKFLIEEREMTEKELAEFKPVNPDHKPATATDAANLRAENVQKDLTIQDKDDRIKELERQLAAEKKKKAGEAAEKN